MPREINAQQNGENFNIIVYIEIIALEIILTANYLSYSTSIYNYVHILCSEKYNNELLFIHPCIIFIYCRKVILI